MTWSVQCFLPKHKDLGLSPQNLEPGGKDKWSLLARYIYPIGKWGGGWKEGRRERAGGGREDVFFSVCLECPVDTC